MSALLDFFSLSGGYIEILLSSVFIANIAAITLSGNYFSKIDELEDSSFRKLTTRQVINNHYVDNIFIPSTDKLLEATPQLKNEIDHKCDEYQNNVESARVSRGWTFTRLFLISECILCGGLAVLLVLGVAACDSTEICKYIVGICGIASLIVFLIGIIYMCWRYKSKLNFINSSSKKKRGEKENIIEETKGAIGGISGDYMPKSIKTYYDDIMAKG